MELRQLARTERSFLGNLGILNSELEVEKPLQSSPLPMLLDLTPARSEQKE